MNTIKDHCLISVPHMNDTLFEKSVIYICEHSVEGAMGLIINKPINQTEIDSILQNNNNLKVDFKIHDKKIFLGGPVLIEKMIVLHSNDITTKNTIPIGNNISITSDKNIMKNICKIQNSKYKIFLGHSGWGKGQLEREIENGDWLIQKSSNDLIFDMPKETIWEHATKSLGIEIHHISNTSGSA